MQNLNFRSYALGGITVGLTADLPILDDTFHAKIRKFESAAGSPVQVSLHHHFNLPDVSPQTFSPPLYCTPPWKIYLQDQSYYYFHGRNSPHGFVTAQVGIFSEDHTQGKIYNHIPEIFRRGQNESLTLFPTDQILFARLLADIQGCIAHAAGMILNGQGLLFAGHSDAGKSTVVSLLRPYGEILCDDRNVIRRQPEGWRLYGTWSHGDIPDVSPACAPLRAILLLEQAAENRLIPIDDRSEIVRRLPFLIIKPLVTIDWWEKTLDLVGQIAREVPVYRLRFAKSERVIDALQPLLNSLS